MCLVAPATKRRRHWPQFFCFNFLITFKLLTPDRLFFCRNSFVCPSTCVDGGPPPGKVPSGAPDSSGALNLSLGSENYIK